MLTPPESAAGFSAGYWPKPLSALARAGYPIRATKASDRTATGSDIRC